MIGRLAGWFSRLFGGEAPRAELFVPLDEVRRTGWGYNRPGKVDGLDANVVMAPVQWVMRTFTQAEPVVERKRAKRWTMVDDHPVELLLRRPNAFYDGDAMMKALLISFMLDGNGYLLKARSMLRGVAELWYVPHWLITPRSPRDGSRFISHYEYRPDGGRPDQLAPSDVVHIRFGLDPRDPRVGLSPLKAALREVLTDEEASEFAAHILGNMGVPGGVISPKSADAPIGTEELKDMKRFMSEDFTGKQRGGWLVLGKPTEISQFGFDPNNLQLGPLRDISEERVCAMLGIPAAVVGFGAGLQQTKVGATMRELVRLARVNCVEPMQTTIGRQLGRQLLDDFESRPHLARIAFDNSGVGMFQEDETEVARRAADLYKAGVAKRNESRAMVGLEEDLEEGDKYVSGNGGGGGGEGVPVPGGVESGTEVPPDAAPPPPPPGTNRIGAALASPNGDGSHA